MHFIFTFIPLLLAFASAKAAPADLAERQSCPEGDGKRHYVILKPGEWTNVNSLDKNEFDSWTYLGGYQQSPPWYFSPNPPDGSRPYTVEHFNLWTYVREDRGWYATSQDTEHRKVAHKYDVSQWPEWSCQCDNGL